MSRGAPVRPGVALLFTAALIVVGCAPTSNAGSGDADTTLVLADPQPLGQFNPINGYGELGVSALYDGLLRPESTSDTHLPDLVPALAKSAPTSNADSTVWDVELRDDVTFSDGSPFDADDVVATYEAVLAPESASTIAAAYSMINTVTAVDAHHVRFELDYPYAAFPVLLLLGIAPAEALTGGPAADSTLNREPVGTGPYTLSELTSDQAIFEANPNYWAGGPAVSRFITVHLPDDNARAQRMRAGGIDGTVLPPNLARSFTAADGVSVLAAQSADWRGISLPAENPFTNDEQARLAMNIGVDRQAMIDNVLAGHGRPAHTPAAAVYGDGFNPDAVFEYDPDGARDLLDAVGWVLGSDGVRQRDGERAAFTILYDAPDTVRRDLATAFATDMEDLGIEVTLEGTSWDEMDKHVAKSAILLGGGDRPYDLDTQLFGPLHSRSAQTATYDNPAGFTIPGVDDALDEARRSLDPAGRADNYRAVQAAYVAHPTHVLLAFLDHTYVAADNDWEQGPLIMEPHSHGVTWGPWWNLAGWRQ